MKRASGSDQRHLWRHFPRRLNPVYEPGEWKLYLCKSLIVNGFLGGLLRPPFRVVSVACFFISTPHFVQSNQRSALNRRFCPVFATRSANWPVRNRNGRGRLPGLERKDWFGSRATASCAQHPVGRGGSWSGWARLRRSASLRRTQGPQARVRLRQWSSRWAARPAGLAGGGSPAARRGPRQPRFGGLVASGHTGSESL